MAPLIEQGSLEGYQPLHAAHAELLRRDGDLASAVDAYRRAISLSDNSVERAELERRLAEISPSR
jgi:RNA polymerase sigma-70 factor (ECF subfamily)